MSRSRLKCQFVPHPNERPGKGHTDYFWSVTAEAAEQRLTLRFGLLLALDGQFKLLVTLVRGHNRYECYTMSVAAIDAGVC